MVKVAKTNIPRLEWIGVGIKSMRFQAIKGKLEELTTSYYATAFFECLEIIHQEKCRERCTKM